MSQYRITPNAPALVLAPMQGLTDAPMRAIQAEIGAFTLAVSEFVRVSQNVPPARVFHRYVPELACGATTCGGLPVAVQILGGDPERMAQSAAVAVQAGATIIDINFGCPAPTVNNNDGGATLLKYPTRLRDIVRAVRGAVPAPVPVSAKLRLGWESETDIHTNAQMACEGGADWIIIHARTRAQGYRPPAHWHHIARVRAELPIPVVANGDIWTLDDFLRCRDITGCTHYMIGRPALSNPRLSHAVARELGLPHCAAFALCREPTDWADYMRIMMRVTADFADKSDAQIVCRMKQWLALAHNHGDFTRFDAVKRLTSVEDVFALLADPGT